MTKVREIDSCIHCGNFDDSGIPFRCEREKREIQTIDYRIPDWCSLSDTEKGFNLKTLSVLLANYESDEPYKEGEKPPDMWTWDRIQEELKKKHYGDCTQAPQTCMRCFMENVVKKAKWILSQLPPDTVEVEG